MSKSKQGALSEKNNSDVSDKFLSTSLYTDLKNVTIGEITMAHPLTIHHLQLVRLDPRYRGNLLAGIFGHRSEPLAVDEGIV